VIATSTKLDISSVKLPENINDKYFKRKRQKRAKKAEGDIFNTKKEVRNLNIFQKCLLLGWFLFNVRET
jgi:large subunit ribosomal protein L6e